MTTHSGTGSFDLSALNNLNQNLTQYFWFEEGGEGSYPWGLGAHITLYPQSDFTNPNDSNYLKGQNILINTDGFSLRNGTVPLMVLDNDSLDFNLITDLSQGTYVNVATFGAFGATIGQLGGAHSVIDNNGMTVYIGSNDVAFFGETARIGRNASGFSRTEIASTGVQFLRGSTVLANIGYDSGKSQSGSTVKAPFYSFGERLGDIGNYSMAEGILTTASGYASHAEGASTTASGETSHAEGASTIAIGNNSHAEGYDSQAVGDYSHAQNRGTKASSDSQTTIGKYNIEDANGTYALIIGNGESGSAPSNALTVDWYGNVDIKSGAKYKINGTALSASDVGAVPTSRTVNNKALSSNITLTASDVGAVPTSRTVNGKALSANISLTAYDVGALEASPSCIEFSGVPSSAPYGGFIDFHYRGSSADFTSRIIEDSSAHLAFYANNGVAFTGGASFAGGISSGEYFKSTYTYTHPGGASATTVKQNTIYVASNGNFIKGNSASSRRYKHNIKELINEDLDPNLLYKIPIIQFVYNTEYLGNKKDCRYLKTLPGFIAEDIYDIYPVAADISDEGSIEGWNEHYIIPPMLALIQDQHKEIELLKQEINQLKQAVH